MSEPPKYPDRVSEMSSLMRAIEHEAREATDKVYRFSSEVRRLRTWLRVIARRDGPATLTMADAVTNWNSWPADICGRRKKDDDDELGWNCTRPANHEGECER